MASRTSTATDAGASRPAESSATLAGGCVNPIRLRGFHLRVAADTGELLSMLGTPDDEAGVLIVACKDRRASCCPACARLYERDAYQLSPQDYGAARAFPRASAHTRP
jgi:hypothetical protein